MAYKVLTSLVWVLCHNFTTCGYLLFTKQNPTISQAVLDSFGVKFIPNFRKSSPNIYGFASRGVWVMGYCGCMGYEVFFPANQLGGLKNLWDLREYGVCEPWVMRKSTVVIVFCQRSAAIQIVWGESECYGWWGNRRTYSVPCEPRLGALLIQEVRIWESLLKWTGRNV